MIAQKMFEVGGKKVRPGDDLSGLDDATLKEYQRIGLVSPAETKPSTPTEKKAAKPKK